MADKIVVKRSKDNIIMFTFEKVTNVKMMMWEQSFRKAVETLNGADFYVICVMVDPLTPEQKQILDRIQQYAVTKGLVRSAVIADAILTGAMRRMAQQTGVIEKEHYFSNDDPQCMQKATEWVLRAQ